MNIEKELDNLHAQLYELYRGGSGNRGRVPGLWVAVDKLESIKRNLRILGATSAVNDEEDAE